MRSDQRNKLHSIISLIFYMKIDHSLVEYKENYASLCFQLTPYLSISQEEKEEPDIKLPTSAGSSKKQESSRKTSISALLTMPKPLTVWITRNWKILKEMGIPDHLTCLLRNLYAGQEATVKTGHGTTDWFQIGKKKYAKAVYCHLAYLTYMHSPS